MEILDYPFMKSALLMGLLLGVLFSLIGVFVVTRGMAFFSDFIAHSTILGGGLAIVSGVEPTLFLIPYTIIIGFAVSSVWNAMPLSRDTVLGVFYGGTVAFGIILMSVKGFGHTSLIRFLFGDILLIRPLDILLTFLLLAAFAVFLKLNMRRLLKSSFLPEISKAEGINVRLYDLSLIALIALTVAMSIKMVGVILANAMVVIPAATAKTLSKTFKGFMLVSPIIGIASFTGGTLLSYYLNIPSGPAVIVVSFSFFILSLFFKRA